MMDLSNGYDETMQIIKGIEKGVFCTHDAHYHIEHLDPLAVHFVVQIFREKLNRGLTEPQIIAERIRRIIGTYQIEILAKQGKEHPVAKWFDENYDIADFLDSQKMLFDLIGHCEAQLLMNSAFWSEMKSVSHPNR